MMLEKDWKKRELDRGNEGGRLSVRGIYKGGIICDYPTWLCLKYRNLCGRAGQNSTCDC